MFTSDLRFNLEPLDILRLYRPIRKLKIIFDKYKISTRLKDLNLDLGFILDRPNLNLGQSLRVRLGGANRQKSENFYLWCLNFAFFIVKGSFSSNNLTLDLETTLCRYYAENPLSNTDLVLGLKSVLMNQLI